MVKGFHEKSTEETSDIQNHKLDNAKIVAINVSKLWKLWNLWMKISDQDLWVVMFLVKQGGGGVGKALLWVYGG